MGKIVDVYGNPIELSKLEENIGGATVTGVRQVWQDSIASGLTPAKLAGILIAAQQGSHNDFLTLAEDMEERDPHYGSVLGTRKRAISGLEPTIEAATDDSKDQKIAEFCREYVLTECLDTMIEDALDALGKSYSVIEIKWQRGQEWIPVGYDWQDPHWIVFDRDTRRQLRLLTEAQPAEGEPLAPFKFIAHTPRIKSGLPIRNGLARAAAFAVLCKWYAQKDWNAFAEVFGMPLRVGRYGPTATPKDVQILRQAVSMLGTDAAAVLPESMKIDFQEIASGAGGDQLFLRLCEFVDKQVSKAVLGQTSTADAQASGLGSNQASVHNEVRGDILKSDAKQLAATLNRDLIRPLVDLNFGPQEVYPKLRIHVPEPEDTKLLVESVKALVPMGLKVGMSTMRDKLGLPDPEDDEELLQAPAAPSPGEPDPAEADALNRARNSFGARPDAPVVQADRLDKDLLPVMTAMIEKVRELLDQTIQGGGTLEEFRDSLLDLYPDLDASKFGDLMAKALASAQLGGRFDVLQGV